MNKPHTNRFHSLFIATALSAAAASPATASVVNGSFESGFTGWTVTGDWDIQPGGSGSGPTPWGWFSGGPQNGSLYAECGFNGNESTGTLLSSLTTADNRYLTFWHSSNSGSYSVGEAYILAPDMSVLGTVSPVGYNDSVWRQTTIDLQALGLQAGEQYYFKFADVSGWSVIDNISTSGPELAAVPEPASLSVGVLCMASAFIRRRRRP